MRDWAILRARTVCKDGLKHEWHGFLKLVFIFVMQTLRVQMMTDKRPREAQFRCPSST